MFNSDLPFLPRNCLLPLFCFLLTVIFATELGLIEGGGDLCGLDIDRGRRFRDSRFNRRSISFSNKFIGEEAGELSGVIVVQGAFPLISAIALEVDEEGNIGGGDSILRGA